MGTVKTKKYSSFTEDREDYRSPKGVASWWSKDGAWHVARPVADPDPVTGLRNGGFRYTDEIYLTREEAVSAVENGAPAPNPDKLTTMEFIHRWEAGGMTQEQFDASAQAFVDSGIWRHLQGSWQRQVYSWAENGQVTL